MESAGINPIVTVFRSRLRPDAEQLGYGATAARMEARARAMPGFVDFKSFKADDGERVSIITFETLEHQVAWREDPEHRAAQLLGRRDFYAEYSVVVCEQRSRRHYRPEPPNTVSAPDPDQPGHRAGGRPLA